MTKLVIIFTFSSLCITTFCSPYDDGKYNPVKYKINDDGKYYRPLDEGKYIPEDEGRYTYIYRQGLYPTDDGDYRYIHQVGPNGGFGGNGGYGGIGGYGEDGPNGPNGPNGPDGEERRPNPIEYIGRRIYAERYPYIYRVINALVDKYVSSDILASEGSSTHYSKVYADNEVAAKCRYLKPGSNEEFVTQYPPRLDVEDNQKLGSYYSFKGTKVIDTVSNSLTNKLKLQYEVFVRVMEEVTN